MTDTIFALSSGALPAAIAVVRVSGPAAGGALRTLAGKLPSPRRATLAALRGADGALLDRALLLWFPAPATATGEDLAELHLHGGRAVVNAVLVALAGIEGCRPAAAGEFTRRAFANGRIDLLQAEGLADLLRAESEDARRQALRAAEGGLSRMVEGWRERLLQLGARAEAVLEFGADDPDIAPDPVLAADLRKLASDLDDVLAAAPAERLRDGVRVVVAGPPNAGKSTLVNALASRDVALATPLPGTTRDLVEAPLLLGGRALVLIDSAGLRDSDDPVERLGIARAVAAIETADLVVWLGAPEEAPASSALIVHPRCDLPGRELPPEEGMIAVSASTGEGLPVLRAALLARIDTLLPAGDAAWTSDQRRWIAEARAALAGAIDSEDDLLVAEGLRLAGAALDGLTGRHAVEAMLDRLFARFCVGK